MEKRKNTRYLASAHVRTSKNQDIKLFLKDISISGCSITSLTDDSGADTGVYPEINREYSILISPEAESGISPFELGVELCWSRIQDGIYEAGGLISKYPEGKLYQLFANYLAWRAAFI